MMWGVATAAIPGHATRRAREVPMPAKIRPFEFESSTKRIIERSSRASPVERHVRAVRRLWAQNPITAAAVFKITAAMLFREPKSR
jgi:hypothetical protein